MYNIKSIIYIYLRLVLVVLCMQERCNKGSHDFSLVNINMLWLIAVYKYSSLEIHSAVNVKIFWGVMLYILI